MSSPVELSDLPVASSALNGDLVLLRKGLTDYQCAVSLIRNINVASLSSLPGGTSQSTDLFLISRTISGTPQNFQIPFTQVGFPKGTRMWFWMGAPPLGWSIINNTGDRLLAVASQDAGYSGGGGSSQTGTWQQTATALTVKQIPNHQHFMRGGSPSDNSNNKFMEGARNPTGVSPAYSNVACLGIVGGEGDVPGHDAFGGCQTHNHGDSWRPLANVGVLGNKDN